MKPSCKANQTYQDELAAALGLSGDDDDALRHVQHELERYDDILDDEACGSLSAADEDEAVEPVRDEPVRDPRNAVDELCDEEDPYTVSSMLGLTFNGWDVVAPSGEPLGKLRPVGGALLIAECQAHTKCRIMLPFDPMNDSIYMAKAKACCWLASARHVSSGEHARLGARARELLIRMTRR